MLWLLGVPVFKVIEPLMPAFSFFFKMMLIIPEVPSASYFAEGLVMTSTLSIISAVMVPSALLSSLANTDGFPLIKICTPPLPLNVTLPSIFTLTDGTLFSTSSALAPVELKSLPTLKTLLSNLNSVFDF